MSEAATQTEELHALLGTTIAERYRLDELLGIGGMGAVFRARHLLLKRDVAVKILHPQLGANDDISKRFDREAQSAARLDHPNIIPVTEFGSTDDGMKYMVMQLLSGKELGELLGEPLDPLRGIDLEIQILRGLEHAHNNGVIHRDLKPENVFVTTDHEDQEILKLVDFGIAKLIDDDDDDEEGAVQPLTRLGLVFGTPRYMSPEQATGSTIDHRTDIYSAGVLLYQMLAGRVPFEHDDPVSLIRMQVTVEPPPLPDTIPLPLQRVVSMMMAKSRDQRYPDARSARKALQAVQAQLADDAGVPIKMSPHDTGLVDPRDIYPPGHEALESNPAFRAGSGSHPGAASGSGSGVGVSGPYDPSEHSGPMETEASGPISTSAATMPPVSGYEAPKPKMTQMSLADALTQAHPTLQQRSPFAEWMAAIPRMWWYVGGGILGLLLIVALWPSGSDDESSDEGSSSDAGDVALVGKDDDGADEPVEEAPGVDEDTLVAIDVALSSKKEDEALDLIRPARDKLPDDPQLLWREGKALAMKRAKSSRVTALERYGQALDHDPSLTENPDFYGELNVLLRVQTIQEEAINLALQKLGPAGHNFLIELVNVDDPRAMLDWVARHRVLDELSRHPDAMKLVDVKLNLARDLYQAGESPAPCAEFSRALTSIATAKDLYFVEHVFGVSPPAPGSDTEDAAVCETLDAKLVVVRDLYAAAHPDEAAQYTSSGPGKRQKKNR
ncbi:Serine/threonine-protein kinase PknB [Enhygromyxa salina]|uniref:Serine/threonine-protein kinase PknB n=1 Tax=Enhygromyxa salina TaxID=215803 RepID=A0A2S9XK70_9BACT|nr:serine/threonine-protein kinase [Enhygromyxa salina]PRP93274.1 Serine/threonine-protein kinase PknB [Enhygromyxa salina]